MPVASQFEDEVVAVGSLHGLEQTHDVRVTDMLQQQRLSPEVTSGRLTSDDDSLGYDLDRHLQTASNSVGEWTIIIGVYVVVELALGPFPCQLSLGGDVFSA